MSDSVEKNKAIERREARRRRILENSDSRLKKITDMPSADDGAVKTTDLLNFKMTWSQEDIHRTHSEHSLDQPKLLVEEDTWEPVVPESLNSIVNVPLQEMTLNHALMSSKKFHVAFLALVTYIALRLQYGYLFYENIMVPFYTLEFGELVLRKREPKTGLISMVIALLEMYGVSSSTLVFVTHIMGVAFGLVHDLCLYLFIIIICTSLFG